MSLFLNSEMVSHEMDVQRPPGTESKASARFVHAVGFTLAFWQFRAGAKTPEHKHVHETSTTVLRGSMRLTVDDRTIDLHAGDTFIIPSWAMHQAEVLEDTEALDVYTPVREDYVARQNGDIETYLALSPKAS